MKYFFIAIAVFVGIPLLGLGIKTVFFPVNTAQKMVNLAYDAQDKVLNADNAIYNYRWFKQQKQDIDAVGKKLEIARAAVVDFELSAGARKDWTFEDKNEAARLRSISQGIESQLKDMIADYNARSSQADRAIFKDGIFPSYIDAATFIFKK